MLTVIDHAKDEGYLHEEIWGATPVRLIGPLAQADMPEFYARQHVLLAPSLWPESFGLVTREALISGLWVVASDRGAIAEDVTPGINGFVVDVSSPEALTLALAQIDSRPDVYTRSAARHAFEGVLRSGTGTRGFVQVHRLLRGGAEAVVGG